MDPWTTILPETTDVGILSTITADDIMKVGTLILAAIVAVFQMFHKKELAALSNKVDNLNPNRPMTPPTTPGT